VEVLLKAHPAFGGMRRNEKETRLQEKQHCLQEYQFKCLYRKKKKKKTSLSQGHSRPQHRFFNGVLRVETKQPLIWLHESWSSSSISIKNTFFYITIPIPNSQSSLQTKLTDAGESWETSYKPFFIMTSFITTSHDIQTIPTKHHLVHRTGVHNGKNKTLPFMLLL
jgi:hypothetical protein